MNMLYFGEENIEGAGILHIIKNNYPKASIEVINSIDSNSASISMNYDICIVNNKTLLGVSVNDFNRFLSLSNIPVLILAKEEQPLFHAFSQLSNIRGIIKYECGVSFLLNAINIIIADGYCYSWDINTLRDDKLNLFDEAYCVSIGLTPREIEILKMYLEGATNKDISIKLSRSQKTISAHKSNILRKTGIKRLPSTIC